jgi:hypothetical protein
MAGCNEFMIEVDFRTSEELDSDVQRFEFDQEHLRLREQLAVHTVEGSQDIARFQLIYGQGVRGRVPDDFSGTAARYVQTMAVKGGHLTEFMTALDKLSAFHEKNKLRPVTVWALRR